MQSLLAYISKYNLPIKELSSGDILFNGESIKDFFREEEEEES